MFRLSICMMVKNESKNLNRCLSSLNNLRNNIKSELIVVDTGSTDDTIEIAKNYTDKVYFHKWNNDFSEMRNISISYATGEWLLIIDADEELIEDGELINFLRLNNKKYKGALLSLDNIIDFEGRVGSSLTTIRVFLNDGNFRYSGSVHNLPVLKGEVLEIDSKILHYGYNVKDKELMETKFNRTSHLLNKELEKDPLNIYYRYQLATTYEMYGDLLNARIHYERAYLDIKRQNLQIDNFLYLWGAYVKQLISLKEYDYAITVSKEGLSVLPDYLDLIYLCGVSYLGVSKWYEAINYLEAYLEKLSVITTLPIWRNPSIQFYSINSESECRYNLSQAYIVVENWDGAVLNAKWLIDNEKEGSYYFNSGINFYVKASIKSNVLSNVSDLYARFGDGRWDTLDDVISKILFALDETDSYAVINYMSGIKSKLGIFCNDYLEKNFFNFNCSSLEFCLLLGFEEAYYFSILSFYDFSKEILSFSEIALMDIFIKLDNKYPEFKKQLDDYLLKMRFSSNFTGINLKRLLSKVSGIININNEGSMWLYFNTGVEYIKQKYNLSFLQDSFLSGFVNSEEQYFVCLFLITENITTKSQEYISFASEIFPEYTKQMLSWVHKKLDTEDEEKSFREIKDLKKLLIDNVNSLIESNHFDDAFGILQNYLELFELDVEMIELRNKILLLMSSEGFVDGGLNDKK